MLLSGTREIEGFCCEDRKLGRFWLIDSPGWDDTHLDDAEVLATLAAWLNRAYSRGIQLTGILYLHSIKENRVSKSTAQSFEWFEQLCGNNAFRKVQFVTTFWDEVPNAAAERRQGELEQTVYWGNMIDAGARTARHFNDLDSARDIVGKLIQTRTDNDGGTYLDIQEQMAAGSPLNETTVGRNINAYNERQRTYFLDEMARIEKDLKTRLNHLTEQHKADLREERRRWKTKLDRVQQDNVRLHEDIGTLDERVQRLQRDRAADARYAEDQERETRLRQEVQGLGRQQEERLQDEQRRRRLEANRESAEQIVHNYTNMCASQ